MSIASEAYTGLAAYGKVKSIMGVIIGSLIGIVFIFFGILILKNKQINYMSTTATITAITGNQLSVSYTINNNNYSGNVINDNTQIAYTIGEIITIYYDSTNATNIQLEKPLSRNLSSILMIGVGSFVIIISVISAFFVFKYKPVAAIEGAESLLHLK